MVIVLYLHNKNERAIRLKGRGMLNKEIVDINGFSGMPILKKKIIRSRVSKIDKVYNEVVNIFNDVVKKKELAEENQLNTCIKKFCFEVVDMLYEDMFERNAELDRTIAACDTVEKKLEFLLKTDFVVGIDRTVYDYLKQLIDIKEIHLAQYNKFVSLINEVYIHAIFSPRYGCLLTMFTLPKEVEFVWYRYAYMIYSMLADERDIVAVRSRQILNHILYYIFKKNTDRIEWMEGTRIEEKIDFIRERQLASRYFCNLCDEVRDITNKGHHIVTAKDWNYFDVGKCVLETFKLISLFEQEILNKKEVNKYLDLTEIGLAFWSENHNHRLFNEDKEIENYTYRRLGEAYAAKKGIDAALCGRRLLEIWIKKNVDRVYGGGRLPIDKDDIFQGIDFLHEKNIISASEVDAAHTLRKLTKDAMHIEKEMDTISSTEDIYYQVARMFSYPFIMSDAFDNEKEIIARSEDLLLYINPSEQKRRKDKYEKELKAKIMTCITAVMTLLMPICMFICYKKISIAPRVVISLMAGYYASIIGFKNIREDDKKKKSKGICILVIFFVACLLPIMDIFITKNEIPYKYYDDVSSFKNYSQEQQMEYTIEINVGQAVSPAMADFWRDAKIYSGNTSVVEIDDNTIIGVGIGEAYVVYIPMKKEVIVYRICVVDTLSHKNEVEDETELVYKSIYSVDITEEQYNKVSKRITPSIIRAVEREMPDATPNEKILRCAYYSEIDTEEALNKELGVTLKNND